MSISFEIPDSVPGQIHLSNQHCRICCNNLGNTSYTVCEMMYGLKDEFTYIECASCGCLQISEPPADMSKYYPPNYYSFNTYEGKKFKGWLGLVKRLQYSSSIRPSHSFEKLISWLFPVSDYRVLGSLGINKKSRILDIGCGNGKSFLYPLVVCGYENVKGCDPFLNEAITYSNGLCISKCSVFEMTGTWDVITYHHSFEHVSDPMENLRKAASLLTPNGICVIRIPTVSSFAWKHYRTNWVQLDAPRHFFLHSKNSMQILAEKSGLELYDIKYDSTHFQFSGSEKYKEKVSLKTPRKKGIVHFLRRKIRKIRYNAAASKLNRDYQGDQAAFFFRKKITKYPTG